MLRDCDIRRPLHSWLLRKHSGEPDTVVLHEFKMPRPSARIDIAVVNGELTGFEIKSDADTLSRLPRQVAAYNRVFDRVSIVVPERHASSVSLFVPDWWGVIILRARGRGISFDQVQPPRLNPQPDTAALLHALTRSELLGISSAQPNMRRLRKDDLVGRTINQADSTTALREAVRRVLKERPADQIRSS
jgi:hypothetical protein